MTSLLGTLKNKLMSFSWVLVSTVIAITLTSVGCVEYSQPTPSKPDKQAILLKARQSYYVLNNRGLKSFQCIVQPDWEKFMNGVLQNQPTTDMSKLPLVSAVQYSVIVENETTVIVRPFLPSGGPIDPRVKPMVDATQQTIEAFVRWW